MTGELRPYPEYKNSGIPWFGKIPKHWELPRLGQVLCERGELNTSGDIDNVLSVLRDRGVIPYEEKGNIGNKKSEDTTRYKIVRPKDIVVNCMNVIIGSVGISRYTGCLSPVYYVLKTRCDYDCPEYFDAVFRCRPFQQSLVRIGNGILAHRMRIPMELLKCELLPRPPLEEQESIVHCLNAVQQKINRFIRNRRRLIEVLNEQKQAIINSAVTRGLDPNVPMKPSGIDWLGEIPAHWKVVRIKEAARLLRGKFTHRPRNDPSLYDGQYPFIQTGDVSRAANRITSYSQTLNEKGLLVSKQFPADTLVMTIAANIGDVAILGFEACFPDSIIGMVPRGGVDLNFLFYAMRAMKPEFVLSAPVTAQGNLNVERVGAMKFPLPPANEQRPIVEHIFSPAVSLDKAIASAKCEIDLIREYRTRLIADVVTGKMDVRHTAPLTGSDQLEELVEDRDLLDVLTGEVDDDDLSEQVSSADD